MTGTQLAVYEAASVEDRKRYAWSIARAGALLPKGVRGGAQEDVAARVFLIAETGSMLGIHPVAALQGVNVIEGKPTISPALASALVRGAGHKLRVRTAGSVEGGDFSVTATLIRADDPDEPFVETWTVQRAARARLCTYVLDQATGIWRVRARSQGGDPLPWEKYTEAMVEHRCVIAVCRRGAEDVLMGVHYTPEELGGNVDEAGEYTGQVIQLQPQPDGGHGVPRPAAEPDPNVEDAEVVEPEPEPEPEPAAPAASAPRPAQPPAPAGAATGWDAHAAEVWLGEVRKAEGDRDALLNVWRRCGNTGNLHRPAFDPELRGGEVITLDQIIKEAAEHAKVQPEPAPPAAEPTPGDAFVPYDDETPF